MLQVLESLGSDDPGNFRQALDDIYRDLGRAVHSLALGPDPFEDEEATAVTGRVAEAMVAEEDNDEDEVTHVSVPRPGETSATDPAEHTDLASRGLPTGGPTRREAKQKRQEERRAVAAAAQRRGAVVPKKAGKARKAKKTAGDSFGRAAVRSQAAEAGEWLAELGDLLELIEPPVDLENPQELAAEASLVQWCTVDLDHRWSPFPPAIQSALLGMVAARARNLQDRLAVDVGPRIALERLSAYRERSGLSKVEGLYPERKAQTGSWAEDAVQWWETLVDGLRAG